MADDNPSQGIPTGWKPQTELEHFMQCPVCKEWFDCRDLAQVFDHLHEGPDSDASK